MSDDGSAISFIFIGIIGVVIFPMAVDVVYQHARIEKLPRCDVTFDSSSVLVENFGSVWCRSRINGTCTFENGTSYQIMAQQPVPPWRLTQGQSSSSSGSNCQWIQDWASVVTDKKVSCFIDLSRRTKNGNYPKAYTSNSQVAGWSVAIAIYGLTFILLIIVMILYCFERCKDFKFSSSSANPSNTRGRSKDIYPIDNNL
jgi:hypothetical protein